MTRLLVQNFISFKLYIAKGKQVHVPLRSKILVKNDEINFVTYLGNSPGKKIANFSLLVSFQIHSNPLKSIHYFTQI